MGRTQKQAGKEQGTRKRYTKKRYVQTHAYRNTQGALICCRESAKINTQKPLLLGVEGEDKYKINRQAPFCLSGLLCTGAWIT